MMVLEHVIGIWTPWLLSQQKLSYLFEDIYHLCACINTLATLQLDNVRLFTTNELERNVLF